MLFVWKRIAVDAYRVFDSLVFMRTSGKGRTVRRTDRGCMDGKVFEQQQYRDGTYWATQGKND